MVIQFIFNKTMIKHINEINAFFKLAFDSRAIYNEPGLILSFPITPWTTPRHDRFGDCWRSLATIK